MAKPPQATGKWKTLQSHYAYENPWFRVRHDNVIRPNGKEGTYHVVETKGPAVFAIALTENQEIYMVRLNRYTTGMMSWEVPGGNSEGMDLLDAAKMELREEAGLEAAEWEQAGSWQSDNGVCSEISHLFFARKLKRSNTHAQIEEGIEEVGKFKFSGIKKMVRSGDISDGQSMAALMIAALKLGWNLEN